MQPFLTDPQLMNNNTIFNILHKSIIFCLKMTTISYHFKYLHKNEYYKWFHASQYYKVFFECSLSHLFWVFACEEFKVSDSGVFVPPDGVGGAAHE